MKCEYCSCTIEKKDKLDICVRTQKKPIVVLKVCHICKEAVKGFLTGHWAVMMQKAVNIIEKESKNGSK